MTSANNRMERRVINTIFGPSHLVRWSDHVKNGVIKSNFSSHQLVGQGGLPIWSKSLFKNVSFNIRKGGNVAILVGDFRFGNVICMENGSDKNTLRDGFLSINPLAISKEFDLLLFNRSISALKLLQRVVGNQATFIFWDLFCRQIQDRLLGNYIKDFSYNHPIWNYQKIQELLPDLHQINLSPLLTMPMHEVNRLFIDNSSHPSQISYYLLENLLGKNLSPLNAYSLAVSQFENDFLTLLSNTLLKKKKLFLLTGESIWLDTLIQTLGANGQLRLAKSGLIISLPNPAAGRLSINELSNILGEKPQLLAIVSSKSLGNDPAFSSLFSDSDSNLTQITHVNWEVEAEKIICARGVVPNFKYSLKLEGAVKNTFPLNLQPSMVELGPSAEPSMSGIKYILDLIIKKFSEK